MDKFISLDRKYVAHTYYPLPIVLARGKGVWVWDEEGNKFMDMVGAFSAMNHGHAHPKLLKALIHQAKQLAMSSRAYYNETLGPFFELLCKFSHMDMGMPMTSGAEAAETAIKAARKWGYDFKKIPSDKAEIIVTHNNFHGRTTTLVSFSTVEKYKKGFEPYTPGFKIIPFGDAKALEKAITKNTCAFIVEPIQGEAGIIIPPKGYLKKVSAICKKHKILLIVDEIQTGLGRTGRNFAFEHEGIRPDGLILGKSLGGGLMPVSAFLAKKSLMDVFSIGSHGSTFGGSTLACAVGLEAIKVLQQESLTQKSRLLGKYFLAQIKKLKSPYVQNVRGRGLWIALDIDPKQISARQVCEQLMKEGLLTKDTREVTIRLAPPLVITKKEIDWAVSKLKKVLCG